MRFITTKDKSANWSFKDAVIQGLAPDGGLFMPERITPLPSSFFKNLESRSLPDMSFDVASQLIGDSLPADVMKSIVNRTLSFDVPLVKVEEDIYSLELYHGPTLAFKDFGARFLANLMSHFAKGLNKEIVVLAATSGDTGSAVANGFYNVYGVRVIILYPSGKVSPLQEQQLTTLGGNITAWEVQGTFDDCQRLVKAAFVDDELRKHLFLTSANSINLGRLLPQAFYYFYGWSRMNKNKPVVVSVPSGNFGNLTAGVLAKRLGLPIQHFVAATNANDVVPEYLDKKVYKPRPSTSTISNAMDVGDPSNFARLMELYSNDHGSISQDITGYRFSDAETRAAMNAVLKKNYLLDPHGAVGYLGLKHYLSSHSGEHGFFLETAHPSKFVEVVEETTGHKVEIPERLAVLQSRKKQSTLVSTSFEEAKQRLLKL